MISEDGRELLLKVWIEIEDTHDGRFVGHFFYENKYRTRSGRVVDPDGLRHLSGRGVGTKWHPSYFYADLKPDSTLVWGDQAPKQNW